MLCLDTNVVISFFNARPRPVYERFLATVKLGTPLGLPVIALFELWHGARTSARREENEARIRTFIRSYVQVLAFDGADAQHAGDIFAALKTTGQPIGHYDVLIAAQARSRGLKLVTANTREFARVEGLTIEDWTL